MFNCATQILVPRFELDELMGIMGNFEQITFFPSVPTMINAVLNHPKAEELQLDKKLGMLNSGAAPMPVELIDQARDMGIYFSEGWGMSETTSLGIANPILGLKMVGSIGIPFPDTDVKLVDVEGSNLALVQRREGMRKHKPSRVRSSQPPGSVFPSCIGKFASLAR
jgi:long-chain acyl-CoA synthetase